MPPRRRKPRVLPAVTSSRKEGDRPRSWVSERWTALHSLSSLPRSSEADKAHLFLVSPCPDPAVALRPCSGEHERGPRRGARLLPQPQQPQQRCSQQQGGRAGAALRRLRDAPARLQLHWQTTGNGVYCAYCPCSRTSSFSLASGTLPPRAALRATPAFQQRLGIGSKSSSLCVCVCASLQGQLVCQVKLSNGLMVHGPQCQSENDAKENAAFFALQRLVRHTHTHARAHGSSLRR